MSDWYPAIRECCTYWDGAAMLHQTFQSFESDFEGENDACIDSAKSIVECVCRLIIDELDDPSDPKRPEKANPSLVRWVSSAAKVLKLSRKADDHVMSDFMSGHTKLAEALNNLRNSCGPVSHGRPAFLDRLSQHHRRAGVLAADAIIALLHQAYLKTERNLSHTREPYDNFSTRHKVLDKNCAFLEAKIDEDGSLVVTVALPDGADPLSVKVLVSEFLFHLERPGYIEAFNASLDAQESDSRRNRRAA
ncbi:MAG: abortive infection family protein [Synechococcus sp. SB0662_bin_45]|nr:abortive infection family protein [Synechococcus sp. SB0662_bin_45]